ncbi:MAG: MerR family transcriptional regulator [Deltaproteobacteria bacterium]|nr:MerR family transcriptional regulator [Deltaproteobacteria bacterium]
MATIPDKLYFKIGEVGRITGVKPYVLRYWETEFKIINPHKSRANQRVYRKGDIELILEIKRLLYDERYTLPGAKAKIKQWQRERNNMQLNIKFPDPKVMRALKIIKEELYSIKKILTGDRHETSDTSLKSTV